uniref:Uncharacterized protein n=1 Tax=Lepeophtheirus salmonis TaxID=72036 RepID=A0A0K2U9D0_LEPSM
MRRLADKFNMDKIIIRIAFHNYLPLKSFIRTLKHLLTLMQKSPQLLEFDCEDLLRQEDFHSPPGFEPQKPQIYSNITFEVHGTFKIKHPAKQCGWESWALMRRKLIYSSSSPTRKSGLRPTIRSWLEINYPENNYVLTQIVRPAIKT